MAIIVGISGAARNAAAALCDNGRVVAVCEQERVTRTRRTGLNGGWLPAEAVQAVLAIGGRSVADISSYAIAEPAIHPPPTVSVERVSHHRAHAATAFFTSPFDAAVVLVCDHHQSPALTIWQGTGVELTQCDFHWQGPAFAHAYSRAAEAFGFAPEGDEHRLEALASVADDADDIPRELTELHGDRLDVSPGLWSLVEERLGPNPARAAVTRAARVARGVQQLLGQNLVQLVEAVKRLTGGRNLCLGGGLFYNSYFTTAVAESGLFEKTFVPVNPGNPGVAVGAAMEAVPLAQRLRRVAPLSPFLGPEFDAGAIKAALDNCKLSYDYADDGQVIARAARELSRGKLVGWFQGRMEWGPRALGNRSMLASPVAPFVLENLNDFLKHREPHRSYGVSICEDDLPAYFRGPASSRFMEYQYDVLRPDELRPLLPLNATRLRVQSVPATDGAFYRLIKAFGAETGIPAVVNTSFNGFNEPIVCTPRDAVRVFYGTGLDTAVIGNFILQK